MVRVAFALLLLWLTACASATPPPASTPQVRTIGVSATAEPWLAPFYACAAQIPGLALQRVPPAEAEIQLQIGEPAFVLGAAWQVGEQELALVVREENPVSALTAAQIADLFQGRVSNWAAVGGEDAAVQLWLYPPHSDATLALQRRYLGGGGIVPSARWQDDTAALAARLRETPGALGLLPLEAGGEGLRAAARWSEPVLALTEAQPDETLLQLLACVQAQSQKR